MKKATKLFALLIIVSTAMSTLASCGVAENIFGEKHTHKYGEWIKKSTPTCTDSGEWIRYCECGEKQTENFPAIGHSFENGVCKNCAQNDPSYKVEDKDDNKTDDSKDDEVNEAVRIIVPKNLKEGTFGYAHWTIFKDAMIEGIASSPIEVANVIVNSGIIPFTAEATKVEVENKYFTGFDYYTIEGYKSCATFIPTMASTAYVGYIFELEDGVDIYGFIDDLAENCNPRWNICVTADETLVGACGNTVFFLMCPTFTE